jgi:methionyl-tRNA formyltransferase
MGWPVFTPKTFKDTQAILDLKNLDASVAVVASYGLLLPQNVLDIPTAGCINVHPSILPRWRGASPLIYPILMGDKETGVAIMVMDAGMDTGPILIQKIIPITPGTTTTDLAHQLAQIGGNALCQVLPDYLSGQLKPAPQGDFGITLAPKISKDMGFLDCRNDAHQLVRKINALQPWPGTWVLVGGEKVVILKASARDIPEQHLTRARDNGHSPSKEYLENAPKEQATTPQDHRTIPWEQSWALVCGQNTLLIPISVRAQTGKIMDAAAFMRGHRSLLGL